jgi:hypothetical protein
MQSLLIPSAQVPTLRKSRRVGQPHFIYDPKVGQRPIFYLLFDLLWFANRAMLEPMDQSLPPRPALFLRLMLILKPSRFGELFSDLWVTHPHTKNLFPSLMPARSHPRRDDTGTRQALPNSVPGSSQCQSGLARHCRNRALALIDLSMSAMAMLRQLTCEAAGYAETPLCRSQSPTT